MFLAGLGLKKEVCHLTYGLLTHVGDVESWFGEGGFEDGAHLVDLVVDVCHRLVRSGHGCVSDAYESVAVGNECSTDNVTWR